MTYECFEVTEIGKVTHVQLSRGDNLNTMIPAFWSELPKIINAISDEGKARAIVISSTGKHFCAGMDLSVFTSGGLESGAKIEKGRRNALTRGSALHLQDSFTCFEKARMPVLTAIQGGCVGGAVDMVTAADMRYASEDAWFCIQEINIGMTADVGTLQRLPKIIPEGVARELAYTGRRMSAKKAYEVGLVNQIFSTHEELVEGVLDIAGEIATKSPLAIWGTKESINFTRDHSVADSLNFIATWQAGMYQPQDMASVFEAQSKNEEPEFDDLPPARPGLA
ncbi:MAG: enoyl-CoA hydratase [Acidimicrobiaceae bacterium TMED77]|nr:MAG: enoyl-CoA hydratase [Acidimicrobiaceae bacterium TMED77]|tara:strand:+ start:13936 stop:14778 length:843 start_codon:yes stop_codon:yes gene_type:complete